MSSYKKQVVNRESIRVADLDFWGDTRFDPSDSSPTYVGNHLVHGAATSDPNWKIRKFTYAVGNITRIELAYGAWDDRATLF